ncbi:DUF4365 domain-containing protein [Kocuria sp. KSNUG]|uniref:DUF4365 domain-containing protein n=1 Tax=Kocuria sp. KSNUG TaxID=3136676 RepID=UPI003C2D3B5A
MSASQVSRLPHQTLARTARTGRFGVAYVRAVMASAGVGFSETSSDEDVIGIDANIEYNLGPVRVQVKATTAPKFNQAGEARIQVTPQHWEQWSENLLPVYGVLVVLENTPDDAQWMDSSVEDVTRIPAAAYWAKLNGPTVTQTSGGVVFPRSQRFTADTVREIFEELERWFGA